MYIIIFITAIAAGFVQAVAGFGGNLTILMVLPYFFNMIEAAALPGIICFPIFISVAFYYRHHLRLENIPIPTIVYLISNSICIRFAASVNLNNLKAVFGIFLILLAIYFNFISGKIQIRANMTTALMCGLLAGATGGLFGISGPILVLYYLAASHNKQEYLGTLSVVFAILEAYSAIFRAINGIITIKHLPIIFIGFIAVMIGQHYGTKTAQKIDDEKLKKIIYLMLAISGLVTFLRAMEWI